MKTTRCERIFLFSVSGLSLALRLLPWKSSFADRGIVFFQTDAYYHLRRTTLILHNFPRIPAVDTYMAYPYGAECPWPPLYDLVLAAISCVAGLGSPDDRTVAAVTSLLPPVLAALTVVPLFLLVRALTRSVPAAAVAAAFFIAAPGHLGYSLIGSGDHHTAELLLLVTFLYLHVLSLSGSAASGLRHSILAGLTLGASILVWQGAIVFSVIPAGAFFLEWLATDSSETPAESRGRLDAVARSILRSLATAFLLVSLARAIYPSGTDQTRFGFGFFSWFQPAFLLAVFSGVLLMVLMSRAIRTDPRGGILRRLWIPGACAALTLGLVLLVPAMRRNVGEGLRFIAAADPFLSAISEFQPSLDIAMFRRPFSFAYLSDLLYAAILLLPPVMAATILLSESRRKEAGPGGFLLVFWTVLIAVLAFRQRRWMNAYAANIVFGIGWAVSRLHAFCQTRGLRFPAIAPVALASLLAVPFVYDAAEIVGHPPLPLQSGIRDSVSWLRDNTPKTQGHRDVLARAEYSVFSLWDYGHLIEYEGRRPTMVNNFGTQLRGGGIEDMLRVFFAPDEESVAAVFFRRGVRYAFLTDIYPFAGVCDMSRMIGIDFYDRFVEKNVGRWGSAAGFPNDAYRALPYSRLLMRDGSVSPWGPALTRFRLVHESASEDPTQYLPAGTKTVKIFEFVRGARIQGRAKPNERVTLSCRMKSDAGRVFTYATSVLSDPQGNFSADFPYSTRQAAAGVTSLGQAEARTGTRTTSFDVAEDDVIRGNTVIIR